MSTNTAWIPTWESISDSLTRVSGLPVGLPDNSWPICGLCKTPLAFIGQIEHGVGSVDLGDSGAVLYTFMCRNFDSECECEEHVGMPGNSHGTHKIIIHTPESRATTKKPKKLPDYEEGFGAVEWTKIDEAYEPSIYKHLTHGLNNINRMDWPSNYDWSNFINDSKQLFNKTKVNGIPTWIQDPWFNEQTPDQWEYVAQFTDSNFADDELQWSTLESGILFLLKNRTDDYELYYQGR